MVFYGWDDRNIRVGKFFSILNFVELNYINKWVNFL